MAYYIFNLTDAAILRTRTWTIAAGERYRDALAPGDRILLYLGAPDRTFIGRAELGSTGDDVTLSDLEEWDPPVAMSDVLSRLEPIGDAKADFDAEVVQITAREYETALAVAAVG